MKVRGFTLAELSVVLVVISVLATAAITGILMRREAAYLEELVVQAHKMLQVAERVRIQVVAVDPITRGPIRYAAIWPVAVGGSPIQVFNKMTGMSFPENSKFDTPYSIEINANGADDPIANPDVRSYAKVSVRVPGRVSPLGAVATPEGKDTLLSFYTPYEEGINNRITVIPRFEKRIWYEQVAR